MTDRRVRIHISQKSTAISAGDALTARTYNTSRSSSSFLPSPSYAYTLTGPSRLFRAASKERTSASASWSLDTEAERAATISRLSRFAYRDPTPTRCISAASNRERSRSASVTVITPILEAQVSNTIEVATHRDRGQAVTSAILAEATHDNGEAETLATTALEKAVEAAAWVVPEPVADMSFEDAHPDGISDDEELDRLQAEADRNMEEVSPRAASAKRRKLEHRSPPNIPQVPERSPSLAPIHDLSPSPVISGSHSRPTAGTDRDVQLTATSPRSADPDEEEDDYPNSMIDDRPLPSFHSSDVDEADPESEAVTSRIGDSSPVISKKGRSARRLDPDKVHELEESDEDIEVLYNDSEAKVHVKPRKKKGRARSRSAESGESSSADVSEGEESEPEVDWTPSPPSQRQLQSPTARVRRTTSPVTSTARRRISTGRRAALAARAAARNYVVLSDAEDEEFDPDRPSDEESEGGRRHRLESAFERQYRRELAAESEGTEEDDEYDDDPDDERHTRRIEEEEEGDGDEGLELGSAFQVHNDEIIVEDDEDETGGGDENAGPRTDGTTAGVEADEYDLPDDFFADIDPDELASASSADPKARESAPASKTPGKGTIAKATLADLFNSPPPVRYDPSSSGPSAVSGSIPIVARAPVSSLLSKIDKSSPAASAPSSTRKDTAASAKSKSAKTPTSTSGKGKGKTAASTTPLEDIPTNLPADGLVDTITDNFIRVSIMPPREKEFYMNHWRRGQEGVPKAPMRLTAAAKKQSEDVAGLLPVADDHDHVPDGFDDLDMEGIDWDMDDVEAELRGPQGPDPSSAAGHGAARGLAPVFHAGASSGTAKRRATASNTVSSRRKSPVKTAFSRSASAHAHGAFGTDDEEDDFDPEMSGPQGPSKTTRGRGRGRGRGGRGWWGAKSRGGAKKRGTARAKK